MAATVSAREVITFPKGTLTIVRGIRENQNAVSAVFFDQNNNRELDVADQMILVGVGPIECPKPGKYIEDSTGRTFCVTRPDKDDLSHYGPIVGSIFKQAWSDRTLLPQAVKPQSEGICRIDAEKVEEPLMSTAIEVRFQPALTLQSRTASATDRYTAKQMRKIVQDTEGMPSVDPQRCYEAESSFKSQLNGRELSMKLYISGRPYSFVPIYTGIHELLGLKELPYLPHISYESGSTRTHHLNIK